jgi:hypothetical protein
MRPLRKLVLLPAAGAERLVTDGALPHIVRLLRSPDRRASDHAVTVLAVATTIRGFSAVAEALLADATAAPALVSLLPNTVSQAPFLAACVLGRTLEWALESGSPEASRRAGGLVAAVRRARSVPRLVQVLRSTLEVGLERRNATAVGVMASLALVCHMDADAAREALGAGAWPEACGEVLKQNAQAHGANDGMLALSLSLLADLVPHLRGGAAIPSAAAAPGLVPALARSFSRAPAGVPHDTLAVCCDAGIAGNAAAVLVAALSGSDAPQRAAEFVQARGASYLVRAPPALGSFALWGRAPGPLRM